MGTTFTAIQIKNSKNETPAQFKKSLYSYFKKQGLIPTTEQNFEYSYTLKFSDNKNWMSLSLPEGESLMKIETDAEGIAKELDTYTLVTSVWDSDFIDLELYGSTENQRDTVIAGRPFDDDSPMPKGNKDLWEPLFVEGNTWEQFTEIINKDYVYMEDALTGIAPLLGMEPKNMMWGDEHSTNIYLKEGKKPGVVSFPTAFKKAIKETLEPLGFVKIKGKQPYFVRMVGDEILHIITYRIKQSDCSFYPSYTKVDQTGKTVNVYHGSLKGFQSFALWGGIATVYREHLDLTCSPRDNGNWFYSNYEFYRKFDLLEYNKEFTDKIKAFEFENGDVDKMHSEIKRCLETAKKYMLHILDKVNSLEACVEYFHTFSAPFSLYASLEEHLSFNKPYNEGLLLIKTNNKDDGKERLDKYYATEVQLFKEGRRAGTLQELEEMYEDNNEYRLEEIAIRDKIFNTPELYAKVMEELERRKKENKELLRSYGLNV